MSKPKITYDELISALRHNIYKAPDRWMRIEDELKIYDELQNLKTYTAPDNLWDKIEDELEGSHPIRVARNRSYFKLGLLALVSSVLLLIGYYKSITDDSTAVSYSSDIVVETNKNQESATQSDLEEAYKFIDNNEFLFTTRDKLDYEKQLKKLDEAIAEIIAMQEMYGADKRTKKMLAKIEREKAELIKSMIKGV